jgi:hypothetical protein
MIGDGDALHRFKITTFESNTYIMVHLVNMPETRMRKTDKGYIVERKVKGFFSSRWVHIISMGGMPDVPAYFSTYEMALDRAHKYFESDLIIQSRGLV